MFLFCWVLPFQYLAMLLCCPVSSLFYQSWKIIEKVDFWSRNFSVSDWFWCRLHFWRTKLVEIQWNHNCCIFNYCVCSDVWENYPRVSQFSWLGKLIQGILEHWYKARSHIKNAMALTSNTSQRKLNVHEIEWRSGFRGSQIRSEPSCFIPFKGEKKGLL